jgi:hypothetical protein
VCTFSLPSVISISDDVEIRATAVEQCEQIHLFVDENKCRRCWCKINIVFAGEKSLIKRREQCDQSAVQQPPTAATAAYG